MTAFNLNDLADKPRRHLTEEERKGGRYRLSEPGGEPPEITLTDDQADALQAMMEFEASDQRCFTLSGYAGTGKTTVVQEYLKVSKVQAALLGDGSVESTHALVAPTNKAVRVLDEMASAYGIRVPCSTVHRLLCMQARTDASERYFVAGADAAISGLRTIIVDECSMLSGKPTRTSKGDVPSVYGQLLTQAEEWDVKLMFVGDPAQLPPVGDGEVSPSFRHKGIFLREVVRQAKENPITALATYVRESLEGRDPREPALSTDGHTGVDVIKDVREFNELRAVAYSDPDFPRAYLDPAQYKTLAFTWAAVDRYNRRTRTVMWGADVGPYKVGERYYTKTPVIDWPDEQWKHPVIAASIGEDAVVQDVAPTKHPDFPQYDALLLTMRNDEGRVFAATVLEPDDHAKWQADVSRYRNLAKKRQLPWQDFWRLNDAFAEIKPHYAITCHQSQGSTYRSTFVDYPNIMTNPGGRFEALRCLYTAVTRASDMVYLYEGGK